jgi:glycosyltransferase involved in cell wall biosynthesis
LIEAITTAVPNAEIECIAVAARGSGSHILRQLIGISRSALGDALPAKALFTRATNFRRRLRAALENTQPDLVIINGADLFWVLDALPDGMPVVAVAQNIEQELYARQIARANRRWPILQRILELDLEKLRRYEWVGMSKAGRVIFLSEDDRAVAIRACPEIESMVMPPVFDYEPARRAAPTRGRIRIGMFADFTWWPNRVSLDWFLNEVWKSVTTDVELHLIGYGSEVAAGREDRIVARGAVHHARDAFTMCDLMIAPIVDGAGVKVKVAEALYNRVPIVATPFAARGLPHSTRPAIRICDSADEWIAFLNSNAPRELASRAVPVETAAVFSTRRIASRLGEFLSGSSSRLIA